MLSDLELSRFLERVAERSAPPGAGHVAAVLGALGAALASMAFRGAGGEGEPESAYTAGRIQELDELRGKLSSLVDAEVGDALESSLEVMEAAVAALRLLAVGARAVPDPLRGECAAAGSALRAAVGSARGVASFLPERNEEVDLTLRSLDAEAGRLLSEVGA